MDWSNLSDVADWGDLNKMMEDAPPGTEASVHKQTEKKNKTDDQETKDSEAEVTDKDNKEGNETSSASQNPVRASIVEDVELGGWSDMKQFDDDHDTDWFEEEERHLAKMYGGNFIRVKYTEQGRPGYFCEICLSEMNAKKSLESHCEGMKHLKKKVLWEKNNNSNVDQSDDGHCDRKDFSGRRDRSRSPLRRSENRRSPSRGAHRSTRGKEFRDTMKRGRSYRDDEYDDRDYSRRNRDNSGGRAGNGGPPYTREETPAVKAPTETLTGGTTGLLLAKLAACYIKDEEDASLALNVVSSLTTSLREYYTMKKETKIAELLTEAELKLNTMKALKSVGVTKTMLPSEPPTTSGYYSSNSYGSYSSDPSGSYASGPGTYSTYSSGPSTYSSGPVSYASGPSGSDQYTSGQTGTYTSNSYPPATYNTY